MRKRGVAIWSARSVKAILIGSLCFCDLYGSAKAATIISVTGANDGFAAFIGGSLDQVLASSWSATQAYDHVQISASIGSLDPNFASGTAFLGTRIGSSGTRPTDIIATASFTAPITSSYSQPVSNTIIFSNLTLMPNLYFLILAGVNSVGNPLYWNVNGVVDVVRGTGVTSPEGVFFAYGPNTDTFFPPASDFSFSDIDKPFFDVTGNAVSVPEPSGILTVLVAMSACAFARKWASYRRSIR